MKTKPTESKQQTLEILSLNDLAWRLGVPRPVLTSLSDEADFSYTHFTQQKPRKPFQHETGGKCRSIDNPKQALKNVQRRIVDKLLNRVELPDNFFGAVPGGTILRNASPHMGSRLIAKLDIKSFYPSVRTHQVFYVWRSILRCSDRTAKLLTRLTTVGHHLPQGAPTSPAIANIFLADLLYPLRELARSLNVQMTVYVDDIVYSGDRSAQMMEPTRLVMERNGFLLPVKKRKLQGPESSRVITGVRVGLLGPRATREKVRDVRAGIYNLRAGKVSSAEQAAYVTALTARIKHIENVCSSEAAPLFAALEDCR